MKKILLLLFIFPSLLFAQESEPKEKRTSLFASTSQGLSFMYREAFSNTNDKTYNPKLGYAFAFNVGLNIDSKKKKGFSEVSLGFRSYSNGLSGIADANSATGVSSKTSFERFNYLTAGYNYSRYIKTIKDYKTFFSAGIEVSYILSRKLSLKYDSSKAAVKTKGKQISNNAVATTSPTFSLGYGVELEEGLFGFGKKARLSIDVTYDRFFLGLAKSPSNQYIGTLINYQLLF